MRQTYKVVSLFAGCGGLDIGLCGGFNAAGRRWARNPLTVIWANDFNKDACETYRLGIGHHIVCGDIHEVLAAPNAFRMPSTADIVAGGFPCQPFSHAGLRKGLNDRRGKLYLAMREAVRRLNPKAFIAENVRGILTIDSGRAIEKIVEEFESLGFNVNFHLYHAADYNVPQTRERVFIVGIRKDLDFYFEPPRPTSAGARQPAVQSVLKDLEDLPEGAFANHYWSKGKKNKGQGNNKLRADRPAPTMRAEHHGNIEFHYCLERRLSAREAARIQTFPDSLVFRPSTSAAYRQIGNAVPPVLGWHIGRALAAQLTACEGSA